MNFKTAIAVLLLGATAWIPQAQAAAGTEAKASTARHATEFGPTLPPVGYVNYCLTTPNDCVASFSLFGSRTFTLDDKRWDMLARANRDVNHRVEPISDLELYGKAEVWTLPSDNRGDCEDYVLLKKLQLQNVGFPMSALRITVVLDERGEGHAVLMVTSTEGDFVLDNRRDDILRWSDTNYTFVKRQSENNPRQWVALREKSTTAFGGLSASQATDKP